MDLYELDAVALSHWYAFEDIKFPVDDETGQRRRAPYWSSIERVTQRMSADDAKQIEVIGPHTGPLLALGLDVFEAAELICLLNQSTHEPAISMGEALASVVGSGRFRRAAESRTHADIIGLVRQLRHKSFDQRELVAMLVEYYQQRLATMRDSIWVKIASDYWHHSK